MNAEDFSGLAEVVMMRFERTHDVISLEILQSHPTGNLLPIRCGYGPHRLRKIIRQNHVVWSHRHCPLDRMF